MTPNVTPTIAANRIEKSASSAVAGMNCPRSCVTGVVGHRRLAEVAVDEVLEVDQVTDGERLVEPVVLLEGLDRRRVGGRLLAEVRRRGVARDELGEHERDERDPEHEEQEGAEPAQDEAHEARRGAQAAAARGGSRLRHGRDRHRITVTR